MSGRLSDLPPAGRRRAVALAIVKVVATWVLLFGGYYLAPVSLLGARHAFVTLLATSAVLVLVLAWQIRRIGRPRSRRSRGPAPRAADRSSSWFCLRPSLTFVELSRELLGCAGSRGCVLLHGDRLRHGRVRRYRPDDFVRAAGHLGPDVARSGGAQRRRTHRVVCGPPPDRCVRRGVAVPIRPEP